MKEYIQYLWILLTISLNLPYKAQTKKGASKANQILLSSQTQTMFCFSRRYVMIAYGAVGALIFSLFIIYDTQLMLGGKHKYALDPEEYIFAALNLCK